MITRRTQLAKLTRPRMHNAANRERLFARLDESRETKSAICVVGPPGAGKTTVVASWLDARKVPGLWYQVDPGDADAATFFYYLGEAAAPFAEKARQTLPLLTPEYQHDIHGFSRRFFRALFGLLPEGSVVVLDNYQEVEAGQMFHELVAQAISEIPGGSVLVAVSRRDPPDCYARLIANENVGFVEWDDLKLSLEEARTIIRARLPGISDAESDRLFEECGGWAAGLTLMLDSYRKNQGGPAGLPTERDSIFSYFATQIFEGLPPLTQEFLVATAILPQVPVSLARDLTGNTEAEVILDDLFRRHLFTHRRPAAEPTYWYHALFRAFLKGKADTVLSAEAGRDIERKAARLLEARRDYDDAFQLFHDATDWPAARRLIERHARTLVAQGRGQTLREWILALPSGILEDAPWLRYWLGVSLLSLDQARSRDHLERAFGQFAAAQDILGQTLAASGVLDSLVYEWSNFRPMRRWVNTLAELHDRMGFPADHGIERQVHVSLLIGMLYCAPDHALLRRTAQRVTEMLDEEMDVNSKVSMAMTLLGYSNAACDMGRAKAAVACADPLLGHPELTPFNQVWWLLRRGYYYYVLGDYSAARDSLARAGASRETHGLVGLGPTASLLHVYQIYCLAIDQDARGAKHLHDRMQAGALPDRPLDIFHVITAKADVECIRGNFAATAEFAERATRLAHDMGSPYLEIVSVERVAAAHAILGEVARLEADLHDLRRLIAGTCVEHMECQAQILDAYSTLLHGDEMRGRALIANALVFARAHGFQFPQMTRCTPVPGIIFAEALRMGVEQDYVRDAITWLDLRPPADAPASWPWPVKVLSLGRFEIESDGEKLEFSGKAPRRVLSVLKAIVAGGGQPVPGARLVDSLWPDEEGDAGRKALDVCLVRLRKLLRHTDAVIVRDEQVSLNRELCWVDAWAFGDLVEAIEREPEDSRARTRLGTHALELYHGNFLPADDDDRSGLVARLKYRDLYARLVAMLGQGMETAGRWDEARAIYRRGIDADELAEEFYQGLMRCHAATGRAAEGVAVYRRLRQTLLVVLNIKPSEHTEQLARLLRDDDGGAKA